MWPTAVTAELPARFVAPIVIVADAAPFAPNIPAGTWPETALPVPFLLALPRSRDVGAEAAAELEVALRAWSRAPCTSWRARFDGERAAAAGDDGRNVVLFHDEAWPAELEAGAVAQTVVHVDRAGRYRDADIHLNGKDFRFSLDGAAGTLDLRSVLVHELGHALGLGHAGDPRATMFATGSGLRWRSLEQDDRDGVCSLYPGQGAGGCPAAACPAPFLCVAGGCQRPGETRDVCSPCERVPGACEAAGDDARCIDVGEGASAGRVCGRACGADAECGEGFRCLATSAAGDRQCVSQLACRNGASTCQTDAECINSRCREGACVGRAEPVDAGADGGTDPAPVDGGGGEDDLALDAGGGGCSCRLTPRGSHPGSGPLAFTALALGSAALLLRRQLAGRLAASCRARAARNAAAMEARTRDTLGPSAESRGVPRRRAAPRTLAAAECETLEVTRTSASAASARASSDGQST